MELIDLTESLGDITPKTESRRSSASGNFSDDFFSHANISYDNDENYYDFDDEATPTGSNLTSSKINSQRKTQKEEFKNENVPKLEEENWESDAKAQLQKVDEELKAIEIQLSVMLQRKRDLLEQKDNLLQILTDSVDNKCNELTAKKIASNTSVNSFPSTSLQNMGSTMMIRTKPTISQNLVQKTLDEKHSVEYWKKQFPWSKDVELLSKSYFGIDSFRTNQKEVINATLSNEDCFVIMPTGAGKSLCYQLPALLSQHKLTLVISPLVSLMQDQVMQLTNLEIYAAMITAHTDKDENRRLMSELDNPKSNLKLLYVTPEKIAKSKRFLSKMEKVYQMNRIARIVIDEAHCCSQWGHDFRPDYKTMGNIVRSQFKNAPILALTATATPTVTEDVKTMLHIPKCILFKSGFNRPNLYYEVRKKSSNSSDVVEDIASFIKEHYPTESGIIYCFSKKEAEELTKELRTKGINCAFYHASVDHNSRETVHYAWSRGDVQVIIATISFGMGINKPDVRFVIHHTVSKSIESYYQESGRAGRDGYPAQCILYYRPSDATRQSSLYFGSADLKSNSKDSLKQPLKNIRVMIKFSQSFRACRRVMISEYFGETFTKEECKETCDNCAQPKELTKKDITEHAKTLLKIVENMYDERITLLQLSDIWRGVGKKKPSIDYQVSPSEFKKEDIERIIAHLLCEDILDEEYYVTAYAVYTYLVPGDKASGLQKGSKIFMDFASGGKNKPLTKSRMAPEKEQLRTQLIQLRMEISKKTNVFPHVVMDEPSVDSILRKKPKDMKQLEDILGKVRTEKYGEDILKVIQKINGVPSPNSQDSSTPTAKKTKAKSKTSQKVPKNKEETRKVTSEKKRKIESVHLDSDDDILNFDPGFSKKTKKVEEESPEMISDEEFHHSDSDIVDFMNSSSTPLKTSVRKKLTRSQEQNSQEKSNSEEEYDFDDEPS